MDPAPDQNAQELTGVSATDKPRHAVFISHSGEDKIVAEAVCAHLESGSIDCWIAPRDVLAGRPYSGQITEAIRSAQILLLILSRQSNRSKQVLREVERAAHCQIHLLTFRVEEVEANDDLAYFVGVDHRLDALPGPPETYYAALVRQTVALLQTRPKPSEETEPALPEIYGNFRILRRTDGSLFRLGQGGMGVTWKAIDTQLDRPVALKVIGTDLLSSVQARNRFLREAQAAAKIHHPHVAGVHQFGQEGDAYFYAMEFVEGEDLERYVARQGSLSPANALRVVLQIAQALEAAQVHHLIHRDIKPANLMARISRTGNLDIKLIDFGLAKGIGGKNLDLTRVSRSQEFIGSPAFASPEQCEMGELDTRSDIYSLGVTLWYLLSGKRPFSGTVGQVLVAHVIKPPPFDQLSGVPEPVLNLLKRMLAKNPGDRPQNPQQLQSEVETAAAQLAAEFGDVPDRNPGPPEPAKEALDMEATPELLLTIASPLFDPYLNGFAVGNLVTDRYRLIEEEREGIGGRLLLAQDEKAGSNQPAQVGLKVLHPGIGGESALLDLLENELGVIGKSPHPDLLRYLRLEREQESPFIIREWIHGFLLFDLLRWRGSLQATELGLLLEPLAALLDFVSTQGFGLVEVSVRKMLVACPEDLHPDRFPEFVRRDARDWKNCSLKLNPLSVAPLLYRHRSNRSQQTLVPTSQVMSLTQAEAGIQGTKAVRLFGRLIYELLSGHLPTQETGKYTPLPALNEPGNFTLREACVVSGHTVPFRNCQEFWNALRPNLGSARGSTAQVAPLTDQPAPSRSRVETPVGASYRTYPVTDQSLPKQAPPPIPASTPLGPRINRNLVLVVGLLIAGLIVLGSGIGGIAYLVFRSASPTVAANPPAPVAVVAPTATPFAAIATPTQVVVSTPSPRPVAQATGSPSAPPASDDQAQKSFERGHQEANKRNYQAAIIHYSEAIRVRPDYAEAYVERATAYIKLRQYDKAVRDCNEAIRLKPNSAEAYNYLGDAHAGLNQHDKAVTDYTESIRLKPSYAEAYGSRGVTYAKLNQFDKALDDCNTAIRLEPDGAEGYSNRAYVYNDLQQYDKAITDCDQAIRLKPDYVNAHGNRSVAFFRLQQYAKSLDDCNEALRLQPDPSVIHIVYVNRATTYLELKQYDKALSDCTEAIRLYPDYSDGYYVRGNAYFIMKQYERAASDYTETIRLAPDNAFVYNGRGAAYTFLNRWNEAIADFTEAIRLKPDYAKAYENRGIAYHAIHQRSKAEQDRRKAIELGRKP